MKPGMIFSADMGKLNILSVINIHQKKKVILRYQICLKETTTFLADNPRIN